MQEIEEGVANLDAARLREAEEAEREHEEAVIQLFIPCHSRLNGVF